jgi:hypothetical protein
VHIYVWYVLYFAQAVADVTVTDVAGSSVSGFSSRFLLFCFRLLLCYV